MIPQNVFWGLENRSPGVDGSMIRGWMQAETSKSNDECGLEEPGGRAQMGPEVDLRRRPSCRETAGVRRDARHECLPTIRPRAAIGASGLPRPRETAVLALRLQWRVKARVCCAHLGRAGVAAGGCGVTGMQPAARDPDGARRPWCRLLQGGLQP